MTSVAKCVEVFDYRYTFVDFGNSTINMLFKTEFFIDVFDKMIFQLQHCLSLWLDDFVFDFFLKIRLLVQVYEDLG